MTIYRNKNWTARDYECVNIVFQSAPDGAPRNYTTGQIDNENWIPVDMQEVFDCAELGIDWLAAQGVMKLCGFGNNQFFGYP